MSLNDMAVLITTELGVYDDTSLALCKAFLGRRYIDLWEKYPWGDANGFGSALISAGTYVVDYPDGMDRIITLRASTTASQEPSVPEMPDDPTIIYQAPANSWFLDPVDSTFLIQSFPTIFELTGIPKYYEEIGDASQRQIRLYPIPTWGTTLFFYGKMIAQVLHDDTDSPTLRNVDSVIMAYAYADMLQRQRQYAKADLKLKEALELETNAWNLEQQQANKPRRTKTTTIAGNSLLEMTDAVSMICGQWTPESRLIIKEFIRRNYQQAFDAALWPESLIMVLVDYFEGLILPHFIDRVLGIRSPSGYRMRQADAGLILDVNPQVFTEAGEPITYTTLTPVAVATLPSTTSKLVLASTSDVDQQVPVLIRGEVLATGLELQEQVVLLGTNQRVTQYAYDCPITIAKDQTFGDVTINAQVDGASLGVIPWYVRERKHQRIWLLPVILPDSGQPVRCLILGKRAIQPLVTDQDTPIITGIQQILIAGAAADFYLQQGNIDLSKQYQQKADGAMKLIMDKNTDQAANSPRFVPEIEPKSYIHGGGGVCIW